MRAIKILSLALLISTGATSQNWTWKRGSNLAGSPGKYGTMGVPSATNDPGARHGCATWVDALGNLWLFGGEGKDTSANTCWLNDLWKYDPLTNQWTWIRGSNGPNTLGAYGTMGVASSTNDPGAREFSIFWTDALGNFWLFGGYGFAATGTTSVERELNDLWKYDPNNNQWTWMNGSNGYNNTGIYGTLGVQTAGPKPGARHGSANWTDNNGKLWLFGGKGWSAASTQSGKLNDLWRYDPLTNLWTWMSGSNTYDQFGSYGTQNIPSISNIPGGRMFPGYWTDAAGNLWLFGGDGWVSAPPLSRSNDLWKYNISGNTWTWVSGSNTANPPGVYGTLGVPSTTNVPGGRWNSACWTDGAGDFWLFGGFGYGAIPSSQTVAPVGALNDMFRFTPSTGTWTWIKGTPTVNVSGTYGTQNVEASANLPGGRFYNDWWKQNNQAFWLFGGEGYDSQGAPVDHLNDLWKFRPPCNPDTILAIPSRVLCNGQQATLTAMNQLPSSVAWYTQGAAGTAIASGSVYVTPPLTALNSPSVYPYFAESNSCTAAPRTAISITVNPPPNIQVSAPSSVCEGIQFTVSATGASSYTWSTGPNASSIVVSASSPSVIYTVIGTSLNCQNTASVSVDVLPAPVVSLTSGAPFLCKGSTVTISASGNHSYSWNTGAFGSTISVSPSVTTQYSVVATGTNGCKTNALITQSVSLCEGVQDREPHAGPMLYPSPGKGLVSISQPLAEGTVLVVLNAIGQRVLERKLERDATALSLELAPGVYHYEFYAAGTTYGKGRLVIE